MLLLLLQGGNRFLLKPSSSSSFPVGFGTAASGGPTQVPLHQGHAKASSAAATAHQSSTADESKMRSKPCCIVLSDDTVVHVSSMPCMQIGNLPAMVHALFVKCKVKAQYMSKDVTAAHQFSICFRCNECLNKHVLWGLCPHALYMQTFIVKEAL